MAHELCPDCGGVMMGPIYWIDEAPKDAKICRRGHIAFGDDDLNGYYACDGPRFQIAVTSDHTFDTQKTTVPKL